MRALRSSLRISSRRFRSSAVFGFSDRKQTASRSASTAWISGGGTATEPALDEAAGGFEELRLIGGFGFFDFAKLPRLGRRGGDLSGGAGRGASRAALAMRASASNPPTAWPSQDGSGETAGAVSWAGGSMARMSVMRSKGTASVWMAACEAALVSEVFGQHFQGDGLGGEGLVGVFPRVEVNQAEGRDLRLHFQRADGLVENDAAGKLAALVAALLGGGAVDFPTAGIFQGGRAHGVEIAAAADDEIDGDRVAFLDFGDRGAGAEAEISDRVFKSFGRACGQGRGLDFQLGHLQIDLRDDGAGEGIHDALLGGEADFRGADADFPDAGRGDGARVGDGDVAHAQQVDPAAHRRTAWKRQAATPSRWKSGNPPVLDEHILRDEHLDLGGGGLVFKRLGIEHPERAGVADGPAPGLHFRPLEVVGIEDFEIEGLGQVLDAVHDHRDRRNGVFPGLVAGDDVGKRVFHRPGREPVALRARGRKAGWPRF